jgi:5-methylcytosine-specific restriction endonuclease McrA
MNKYCDNVCQQKHRKHIRNIKIEQDENMGRSVGKKRLIISYLKDTNQWYCHQCGALAEESPLEFHHIDGNRHNNRLSNSMVLCRNCHGRTQNFRGKNKGSSHYI